MVGITAAIYVWVTTGKNIYQQWQEWPGVVLATFTIITFASLVPIVRGQPRYRFGPFEPNAEIVIGRWGHIVVTGFDGYYVANCSC